MSWRNHRRQPFRQAQGVILSTAQAPAPRPCSPPRRYTPVFAKWRGNCRITSGIGRILHVPAVGTDVHVFRKVHTGFFAVCENFDCQPRKARVSTCVQAETPGHNINKTKEMKEV